MKLLIVGLLLISLYITIKISFIGLAKNIIKDSQIKSIMFVALSAILIFVSIILILNVL